ncbi:hypothetical protein AN958_02295 [Leucoagaricus sp. SymC.cos]|nr:hypothetical protein AN958_02295 [Leucoagaricus sp. SymC.cos]
MIPTKTPYSVLSNDSFYSQGSWTGPDAWVFNKPFHSSRPFPSSPNHPTVSPGLLAPNQQSSSPAQRESSFSTTTTSTTTSSRNSNSAQSLLQSSRASSATSFSNKSSVINLGSVPGEELGIEQKKETKLKKMYKRASKSRKALARIFSRSPPSGSPSGGVTKRSSLKSSLPLPQQQFLNMDPFASGNSASSYGLSPLATKPPMLEHKRSGSTPDAKPPLSIDVHTGLQRSPSVSSPLGIPASPSLTRVMQQSGPAQNIRGRDSPFPVDSSSVSLPLPMQRSRSASMSSVTSTGTRAGLSKPSQGQDLPPIPRMPSSTSFRSQMRQAPTPLPPTTSLPDPPAIHPIPSSKTPPVPTVPPFLPAQRPRSKNVTVREVTRSPVVNRNISEPTSQQSRQNLPRNPNHDVRMVTTHEVRVVAPAPSLPSMRAALLDSDPTKFDKFTSPPRQTRSRAGSVRATGQVPASDQSSTDKPRNLPEPPSNLIHSVRSGLPDSRSRAGSISSSRGSSPGPRPPPQTPVFNSTKPAVPQLLTQNLPRLTPVEVQCDDKSNKSSLRGRPSARSIPRSPSLPSLRPHFADAPPLPQPRVHLDHEERRGRSHIRSPSMPSFSLNPIIDKATRQPLPPSIAERLRTRARSSSRSDNRRQGSLEASSLSNPPPLPNVGKKKPTLETIPSASNHDFHRSPSQPSGSTLSTVSSLQSPPSPTTSRLLKAGAMGRPMAASLKSPSLPDLHAVMDPTSTLSLMHGRTRRSHSPPPPLPQTPVLTNDRNTDYEKGSTISSDAEFVPFTAYVKPNLTRPKEHSYPPSKNTARAFHARSNKEIAKEGGWDFLDAPPRPHRSPSIQIPPATPIDAKSSFPRPRLHSQPTRGADDIPSVQKLKKQAPREKKVWWEWLCSWVVH